MMGYSILRPSAIDPSMSFTPAAGVTERSQRGGQGEGRAGSGSQQRQRRLEQLRLTLLVTVQVVAGERGELHAPLLELLLQLCFCGRE